MRVLSGTVSAATAEPPPDRAAAAASPFPVGAPVGVRLRAIRAAQGLSERRLALWLGRSHAMVSRWEAGVREPTLFDLDRVAAVLRVGLDSLVEGTPATGSPRGCSSRAHPASRRVALGQVLAAARAEAGLAPWDVYAATGVACRRLGRIEAGADPTVAEAAALCTLYAIAPSALVAAAKARRRVNLDRASARPFISGPPRGGPPRGGGAGA